MQIIPTLSRHKKEKPIIIHSQAVKLIFIINRRKKSAQKYKTASCPPQKKEKKNVKTLVQPELSEASRRT
jgi:hypothetical protein